MDFRYFGAQITIAFLLREMRPLKDQVTRTQRELEECWAAGPMAKRKAALEGWIPVWQAEPLLQAARRVIDAAQKSSRAISQEHAGALQELYKILSTIR